MSRGVHGRPLRAHPSPHLAHRSPARRHSPILSHAAHLIADPADLCIPVFNGMRYAPVTLTTTPTAPYDHWPEITLAHNGTRARIPARYVAHHRECADSLCIAAWTTASQRARTDNWVSFVLSADNDVPVLITANEHRQLLQQFAFMGMPDDRASHLEPGYPVTAATADQIRRHHPITARPLRLDELTH